MARDFANKVVWITGASKGIGRALAIELSNRGALLGLTARSEDDLKELSASLNEGGRSIVCPGDVRDRQAMISAAKQIESKLGPIDILIANAGTHVITDPLDFNAQQYLDLMEINYGGVINCMDAALPGMLQRRSGHIVGLSSMAGYRGMPTAAAYGASKSAIAIFLEGVRFHLAEVGITTSTVYPGFVKTPLTDKNEFHMPFLLEADRAAKIICNGIAARRDAITFPVPFNWIMEVVRVLPQWLYNKVLRIVWKKAFLNQS